MKRLRFWLTACLTALLAIGTVTACNSGGGAGSSNTLTMATSADYPPYEYVDSSSGSQEIIGFDVDIAKHITEKLGYELKIDNVDFNGLIPALQSKRADFVMAGMTPTAERKQNVDFSTIYYDAKNTIVAKKGSSLTTAESLNGKAVGVQLGSIQETAAKDIKGIQAKPLNRISEMVQELKAGRVEALIMEDTVAKGFIASNPDLEFNTIPNTGESGSAVAFPKGSELVAKFDPILAEMKSSGKMEELVTKWFGADAPAPAKSPS
ncbi:MAG: transporter substrate-binding domain-containing protein [Pegethrix bostrychoides GSE-TBD4-15B]|jgi:polar amino acid transport system substrate-binding protein|uniref:Transporter substrate-binding domain-containing protein n=1 Tax=Pegethrix bostrychoides GSE-TBD4-15B TaxID=2839662 RepID=A0A951PEG1_9CYAN|nr:transporter substrate-binding domain-containing protein [Pegethrix bostrychoides GSE-TBD4-15B]